MFFLRDFDWIGVVNGSFWNFQFTFTFAFSPKIPTECPFPFAFTFSELTFMNAIHELGQLLISGYTVNIEGHARAHDPGISIMRMHKTLYFLENAHKTVENGQEQYGTVRNGERSGTGNSQGRWTVWNDHTVQDHGHGMVTVRSRYGHGTVMVRSRSRVKNERNTVVKKLH